MCQPAINHSSYYWKLALKFFELCALFLFSIKSSDFSATTVASESKLTLDLDVSFHSV